MLFLAGDIGGTKALLQLIELRSGSVVPVERGKQRYTCRDFDSLTDLINTFLQTVLPQLHSQSRTIDSACFGLPGPVNGKRVQLTNLPWVVDAAELEQHCSIARVHFINDFFAAAVGVQALSPHQFDCLYAGGGAFDLTQNHLVIGAGTGLGVAPVCASESAATPVASEGGHFDFAPISPTQQLLLEWLWESHSHVSYERLLSGPGLETLYRFFGRFECPATYAADGSQNLKKNQFQKDHNELRNGWQASEEGGGKWDAPRIAQAAETGEPAAVKALSEFVTIYGAFSGAVSLIWPAPGGLFLAGGMAAKLRQWMAQPYFEKAFLEKGRMTSQVARQSVYLVLDEELGLKGAMHYNRLLSEAEP